LVADDVETQAIKALDNLKNVLEAAGSKLNNVVKVTVFLKSMEDYAKVNTIYKEYFTGDYPPARTCVEVARLPKDALVEIEAIGYIDKITGESKL
jgi:2-iminobutanoate/2-iminopropanoate deaminase